MSSNRVLKLVSKTSDIYTTRMLDKDIQDYEKMIGHSPEQILIKSDTAFVEPFESEDQYRGIKIKRTESINKPWILL